MLNIGKTMRMSICFLSDAWASAHAAVDRIHGEMDAAPLPERLALDDRAGALHTEMGEIEAAMAKERAAGLDDVARKLAVAAIFAREMAQPDDDAGPGWPLVISALRDLLALAPAVAATPGLADLLAPLCAGACAAPVGP